MALVPRDDSNDTTTAVGGVVAALALVAVVLRFWSRHSNKAGFKWDDWLILLALMATIATDVLLLVASSLYPHGAEAASNTDPSYVYTDDDVQFTKLNFVSSLLYFTITSATKLSILLMYRRIFAIDAVFRRQVLIMSIVVVGFWIGCTVADLLNCIPMKWTWLNSLADPRYCFNFNMFWLATGVVEACIDLLIIAMPIGMVRGVQVNRSKKIAIGGVFLVGLLAVLSGIVKVVLSYAPGSREPHFGNTEVWTTVHTCTGIICACLPVCWPAISCVKRVVSWASVSSLRKCRNSFSGWSTVDRRSGSGYLTPDIEEAPQARVSKLELPMLHIAVDTRLEITSEEIPHHELRGSQGTAFAI